jgi:hypothetical protein
MRVASRLVSVPFDTRPGIIDQAAPSHSSDPPALGFGFGSLNRGLMMMTLALAMKSYHVIKSNRAIWRVIVDFLF